MFISPSSQALSRTSSGQVPSLSYSQATGRISFSAKSCAISRSAFCSSVSVKSTTVRQLHSQIDWSVNNVGRGYPLGARNAVGDVSRARQSTIASPRAAIAVTSASAYCSGTAPGARSHGPASTRRHMGQSWTMQEAFGIVIFAVVGVAVVVAIVSLFGRGARLRRRSAAAGCRSATTATTGRARRAGGAVDPASATTRSARCSRPATPAAPRAARRRSTSRPSSRALDRAGRRPRRCARRSAQLVDRPQRAPRAPRAAPLDVEAEVERQLRELGG